jgi:TolB-like protein
MFFSRDTEGPNRDRCAASIAVAPFDPVPLDADQRRIATGFLEDVIAELARAPDFEVLAPRTSLNLSRDELDPRRMAEAFGVTHLLDSSVWPTPDGLQVKASLIETASGKMVWANRYEAPFRQAGGVLEDIAAQVANSLSAKVIVNRLSQVRSHPLDALAAHDCWIRGHERLRRSTPEGDAEARKLFERALSLDPTYARAYAGLSLSHFKRWSWRRATPEEEAADRLALQYAAKAEELDDLDPVVQLVLGRTHVYRRDFAVGRRRLARAQELCPSHADVLMQMAPLWAYLGEAETALDMAAKAFRLNPLHDGWYYFVGFMPFFVARRLEEALAILQASPPGQIFEQEALLAATLAHLGRVEEARARAPAFLADVRRDIAGAAELTRGEAFQLILDANPFARPEDRAFLVDGLLMAGLTPEPARVAAGHAPAEAARFVRSGGLWEATFAGHTARLVDMKGCRDIALLLASPHERVHCMEIAGRVAEGDAGEAMDARARASCQRRIRDLQEELAEAERHGDLARSERMGAELDAVIEQLSAAMGLGGRGRKLGDPAEKARTAVTWRIRAAVKKIAGAHPELGRHLQVSIRTGAFCAYAPERPLRWTT